MIIPLLAACVNLRIIFPSQWSLLEDVIGMLLLVLAFALLQLMRAWCAWACKNVLWLAHFLLLSLFLYCQVGAVLNNWMGWDVNIVTLENMFLFVVDGLCPFVLQLKMNYLFLSRLIYKVMQIITSNYRAGTSFYIHLSLSTCSWNLNKYWS